MEWIIIGLVAAVVGWIMEENARDRGNSQVGKVVKWVGIVVFAIALLTYIF